MTTQTHEVKLNNGNGMPQVGFGVFQIDIEETPDAVEHALRTGYRSIDTAAAYENEAGVADGIERSGIARDTVFLTTKLWNNGHGREKAKRAFERSLERLRCDYVDLYLIHWPVPARDLYVETWQALVKFAQEGRARSIGVSNFQIDHLERVIDATGVTPAINQVELHPMFQQEELRRFHAEHDIATEAWSPLGQGAVLDDEVVGRIADEHGRTPAQIVLRWHLQLGNVVIPKSVTPSRIEENFDLFDFELDQEQMQAVEELDRGQRIGPDPDTFGP
jgi:2,5-diketo-D-gluconate reductase A